MSVCLTCGFLPAQSLLDDYGLADVSSAAEAVKAAVEQQQFEKATELWSVAETVVEQVGTTPSEAVRFRGTCEAVCYKEKLMMQM